jgi:regulator of RNase E activity RraA
VSFGGVTWTPGQYVYADDDGVVVAREMLHDAT